MPVEFLTPAIEQRAEEVQRLLADRGQHRAPSIPDLLVAATAELAGLFARLWPRTRRTPVPYVAWASKEEGGRRRMLFDRGPRGVKPARRPPPLPPEIPEWGSPTGAVIGAGVPLGPIVIAGDRVAVALSAVTAFPTGLLISVALAVRRPAPGQDWLEFLAVPPAAGALDAETLGWGFYLGSLGHVANDDHVGRPEPVKDQDAPTQPQQPMLTAEHGTGGVFGGRMTCWLWPLPVDDLAFVVERPGEGIALTRRPIDGELVRAAARRAVEIW